MDYDLIEEILGLLLSLLAIIALVRAIINKRQQIKQRKQKWEELDRSGQLSEDDKILEFFPFANRELNHEVRSLLLDGKKISAIKMVRERSKLGLREATEYVSAVEKKILD